MTQSAYWLCRALGYKPPPKPRAVKAYSEISVAEKQRQADELMAMFGGVAGSVRLRGGNG